MASLGAGWRTLLAGPQVHEPCPSVAPCLRSDYAVLHDPYVYFKRPPMSTANLLVVESHGCGMNGGLAYVQNVRPDGPVAWMFHRTTEVPLR